LLLNNSTEQSGFRFHPASSTIQQKSNEDSFSKPNKIYKNKISKGKNMKRENNHRKNHPHL
jgi:hypothetical protein